jgi:hypothetical protein
MAPNRPPPATVFKSKAQKGSSLQPMTQVGL